MHWHHDCSADEIEAQSNAVVRYFGSSPIPREDGSGDGPGPQAFLVERGSQVGALRVHYHPVDQFQVFVRGDGKFGGHKVKRWAAHYADRFTPYGPLIAGDRGATFLTLRGIPDAGSRYMPDTQAELADALRVAPGRPRRNETVALDEIAADAALGIWTDALFEEDHLRIAVARLDATHPIEVPKIEGSGAFVLVTAGDLNHDGDRLESGSVGWFEHADAAELRTSTDSAAIALLQLP